MALPLRRVCGHQRAKNWAIGATQALASPVCVDHSWTLNLCTVKPAAPPKPPPGHYACVHAVLGGLRLADPGLTTEPRGLTATQCRPADLFTTVAVWHPTMQQSPKRCSSSCFRSQNLTPHKRNPRPTSSRHRLSSSRCHPNFAGRSIMLQRTTHFGQLSSAQVET